MAIGGDERVNVGKRRHVVGVNLLKSRFVAFDEFSDVQIA